MKTQHGRDSVAAHPAIENRSDFSGVRILPTLIHLSLRTPKLAITLVLMALLASAAVTTFAGYLVMGTVSDYLGANRFIAGLLLGVVFARVPYVREGKWSTVGMLPKSARLPVILTLLALSALEYFSHVQIVPTLVLILAVCLMLGIRWLKRKFLSRMYSFFSRSSSGSGRPKSVDDFIIDADFREKKD